MAARALSTPASALLRIVPMSLWPTAVVDRRRRLESGLARLEDLREELISKLDALDGDPDREPWLGAPEYNNPGQGWPSEAYDWSRGTTDGRERDSGFSGHDADSEPGGDCEPSLGSVAVASWSDQRRWAQGPRDDREDAQDEIERADWR